MAPAEKSVASFLGSFEAEGKSEARVIIRNGSLIRLEAQPEHKRLVFSIIVTKVNYSINSFVICLSNIMISAQKPTKLRIVLGLFN